MLKQAQQQRLVQKLSPQQIQFMKLLQVPTANLEERIKDELESNPALDTGPADTETDPYNLDETSSETDTAQETFDETGLENVDVDDYLRNEDDMNASYSSREGNDEDDEPKQISIKVENTFHDYLVSQLGMLNLNQHQDKIAMQIIGSIDDDGYLRRAPDAIVNDLAFNQNIATDTDEVAGIIDKIKDFDPPGVGASNLQECLFEQLKRMPDDVECIEEARQIIRQYFEEFTKKHYEKIKLKLKLSEASLREAINVILKLTPKPGSAFSSGAHSNAFIIPDFFIYNNNGKLELTLNARNAPELRISDSYKEMLKEYDVPGKMAKSKKEALQFIRQKMDAAKWFIDSIRQRQHTLLITMNTILEFQKEFFLTGDNVTLRPMILKDIASRTQMDISTVSRVVNSKYVQTEFGVYLLKFFFSEGLIVDSGEEVSTVEVKNIMERIIAAEDKQNPLSDEKLMDELSNRGYPVARRTVAKYREQLNIPVARLRRQA